ncbi:MAG: hypothetical protein AAGU74_15140 [Bacillota bacterium]
MKKIVSLVLALVLVLAIAAPALAITGTINPTTTTTAFAPFYDIDLVLIEAPASGLGILSLQAIAANKAYIKDSLVHFALYYKTGDDDLVTAEQDDYNDPVALVSSDVVSFLPAVGTTYAGYTIDITTGITATVGFAASVAANSKSVEFVLASPSSTGVMSHVIIGSGVVSTAANGTILAEILGVEDSVKFAPLSSASADVTAQITALNATQIFSGRDVVKYDLSATLAGDVITYTVALPDGTDAGTDPDGAVIFTASLAQSIAPGSSKNLSKIEVVSAAGDTYLVVDQGSVLAGGGASSLKFYLAGVEVTDAPTIAALTAIYSGVMTFFGFNYSAAGVLLPVHFGRKLSVFYAYDSAAITLYTSAITVPDADTDVPQTGDAATSIGFVMIALAIVAAAGIAYKKVRA